MRMAFDTPRTIRVGGPHAAAVLHNLPFAPWKGVQFPHGSATVSGAFAPRVGTSVREGFDRAGRDSGTAMFSILLLAAALAPQQLRAEIPLSGLGDPLSTGKSFGLAHEPTQDLLYVAVCGDLPFVGTPNRAIAVVDPHAEAVIGEIPVGAFPEEIAFAYDPLTAALRYGACTNNEEGSVTIWNAARQVVATVLLPDPLLFGSCFPSGIAATDDHFFVTTLDGSGALHAIALATLALDPAASRNLGAGVLGGRLRIENGVAWIPHARSLSGFAGSEGGLTRFDLASSAATSWFVARDDSFTRYPTGQDLAWIPGGGAWLGGLDLDGRLWRADATTRLERSLALGDRASYGLAGDAAGELAAACTLWGDELLLLDLVAEELISVTSTAAVGAGHHQPNDALFAHGKLFVTCQGSESLLVFDQLPVPGSPPDWQPGLSVSDSTPARGSVVSATVLAFPGELCWLLGSGRCDAAVVHGVGLRLGPAPRLHAAGLGACSRSLRVPNAATAGRAWYLQGTILRAGVICATAPAVVVIQ